MAEEVDFKRKGANVVPQPGTKVHFFADFSGGGLSVRVLLLIFALAKMPM
ncbi:hypothetical protein [Rikenella microfusus]|nr:hypothetical protein [Rikenella microfusus]